MRVGTTSQQQYLPDHCRTAMYSSDLGLEWDPFYKVGVVGCYVVGRASLVSVYTTSCIPKSHAPPMHHPCTDAMHGPACPSTKTPIPPHQLKPHQDYIILLLFHSMLLQALNAEHLVCRSKCSFSQFLIFSPHFDTKKKKMRQKTAKNCKKRYSQRMVHN